MIWHKPPHLCLTLNRLLLLIILAVSLSSLHAESVADIEFANVDGFSLKLDLHLPAAKKASVLVYVHGGAWRSGSRGDVPVKGLVEHGFAIASVDYRLSTQARFPAQIHDIKAAIRFLRSRGHEFGLDTTRVGIIGSSAGGHLAALVGVTKGHAELEGREGPHVDQSSRVDAIVSFYGASNLQSILGQSTEFGLGVRVPALQLLLGGLPDKHPALAKLASPVAHVDGKDPPLLLIHGDADPQMPLAQSQEFHAEYQKAKLASELIILPGAKHGGAEFYDEARLRLVAAFLRRHLRP
jgi:acetyl esterase/lipase